MSQRTHFTCALIMSLVASLGSSAYAIPLTGNYLENFQSMGASGTTTPSGWFVGGLTGTDGGVDASGNGAVTGTSVQVDNGSITAASVAIGNFNYGLTGDAGSRSLGTIATTSKGTGRVMELRLTNNMPFAITSFQVRYDGKQWRRESTGGNQTLVMKYGTNGSTFVNMGTAFNFDSIHDSGTTSSLNGNDAANRIDDIGAVYTPSVSIPIGGNFYLRWFDFNDAGVTDHGMAIDNVEIINIVPEPTAFALLSLGIAVLTRRRFC